MVNFLVHSQILEAKSAVPQTRPIINNEIFNSFIKCYQGFDKVSSSWDIMDGAWIGIVVDHLS